MGKSDQLRVHSARRTCMEDPVYARRRDSMSIQLIIQTYSTERLWTPIKDMLDGERCRQTWVCSETQSSRSDPVQRGRHVASSPRVPETLVLGT